jgi:hypothetical protein
MKAQKKDLHLSLNIPLINELPLNIVYEAKQDRMIFTRQDTEKSLKLPIILTISAYAIGLFKGYLGVKRFVQLKKDFLRTLRDDYKNGTLLLKNNDTQRMLENDYNIYEFDIVSFD